MKKLLFACLLLPALSFAECSSDLSCCPSAKSLPLLAGSIPDGWQPHPVLERPQGYVEATFDKAIISSLGGMTAGVTCKYHYQGGEFAIFLASTTVIVDKRYRPWSRIYGGYQCSKARNDCRFVIND